MEPISRCPTSRRGCCISRRSSRVCCGATRLTSSEPHRVQPVEVDPYLGGGVLRSRPEEMKKPEFYQVDLTGDREIGVRRYRVQADGQRKQTDFTLTREQLGDLIDEIS